MRAALEEAHQGAAQRNFLLGAVIAFPAEYDAQSLKETTLYTAGEPCAMCTGAIIWQRAGPGGASPLQRVTRSAYGVALAHDRADVVAAQGRRQALRL
jgi:hypothetical protein